MSQVILCPNTKPLLEALLLLGVTPVSSHVLLSPIPLQPPLHLHVYGTSTGVGLSPASLLLHSYQRWLSSLSALHSRYSPLPHKGVPFWPPPLLSDYKYNFPINISTGTSKPMARFPDKSERVPLTISSISVQSSIPPLTRPFHPGFLSFTHSQLVIHPSASTISSAFRICHKHDHSITSSPVALTAFSGLLSPVYCPCCDIPSQTWDLYALRAWKFPEA